MVGNIEFKDCWLQFVDNNSASNTIVLCWSVLMKKVVTEHAYLVF